MPGRGNYWKQGGLPDKTIVSDDIADATIAEGKLDSNVQTKLNTGGGGGGVWEKIGEFDVVTPATSVNIPISPVLNIADFAKLHIVANFTLDASDVFGVQLSGFTFTDYISIGIKVSGTAVTPFSQSDPPGRIGSDVVWASGAIGHAQYFMNGCLLAQLGEITGTFIESTDSATELFREGTWNFATDFSPGDITSVTFVTGGTANINAGSCFRVYKLNK